MCQDVDYHVRISTCEQLTAVGKAVSKETVAKNILDELTELVRDEEIQVRRWHSALLASS